MNTQDPSQTISIISLIIAFLSFLISATSVWISYRRTRTAERSLEIQIRQFDADIKKWVEDKTGIKKQTRLEFLRDLFNGFSSHNWSFIRYWDFPGVFPPLADVLDAIPNKEGEENKTLFGQRVVALEHLNILFRVFSNTELLHEQDIDGFTHWANNWYENSRNALKTILISGDTYPLDFLKWLRDKIFREQSDIKVLFGRELNSRLRLYENSILDVKEGKQNG